MEGADAKIGANGSNPCFAMHIRCNVANLCFDLARQSDQKAVDRPMGNRPATARNPATNRRLNVSFAESDRSSLRTPMHCALRGHRIHRVDHHSGLYCGALVTNAQ